MIQVYDPRGVVGAEKKATAARIKALDGLRLGILDNTKWNANKLLRELRD
ncbi:MAG: UGSC family (seleno)protein, partial [Burkholderiales bacterium]